MLIPWLTMTCKGNTLYTLGYKGFVVGKDCILLEI
jgi:hypothetical protein